MVAFRNHDCDLKQRFGECYAEPEYGLPWWDWDGPRDLCHEGHGFSHRAAFFNELALTLRRGA